MEQRLEGGKRGTWGIYDLRFMIYDFRVFGFECLAGLAWVAGVDGRKEAQKVGLSEQRKGPDPLI
jgi:hypothetical protein